MCRVLAVLTRLDGSYKDETVQLFNSSLRTYKGLFVDTYIRCFDKELYGNPINDGDYETTTLPVTDIRKWGGGSASNMELELAGAIRVLIRFLGEDQWRIQSKVVAVKVSFAAYCQFLESSASGAIGLILAMGKQLGSREKTTPNEMVTFMLDNGKQVTMIRHYG